MTFGEHVFLYCERGTDAALWAEPINAISNAGFFLAALIAWQLLLWRPREMRNADHFLLIGFVFLIGFGSLAFHVYADQWTALADVVPITVFMLVYLGFALNRFLGVPPGWTVLLVIGFAALISLAGQVQCWEGGIGVAGADVTAAKPCLNGSVGYLPALAALIVVGMLLAERHHRAAPYVQWAAVVFAVSLLLRSLDMAFCDQVLIDGRKVGTHFIWHLLNALVLFLLLRASFEARPAAEAETEPEKDAAAPAVAPVEMTPAKSEPKETPAVASAGEEAALKAEPARHSLPEEEPKDRAAEGAPEDEAVQAEPKDEEPEAKSGEVLPKAAEVEKNDEPKGKSKKKPFFPA